MTEIERELENIKPKYLPEEDIIEELFDQERLVGYPTQYKKLNELVGGVRTRATYVIVASQGVGKTLLALNILVKLHTDNIKSVYFDLENGKHLTIERLIRIYKQLPASFLMDKTNIPEAKQIWNEIKEGITVYDHEDILRVQNNRPRTEVILEKIREHIKEGAKVILIDPLQAVAESGKDGEFYAQGELVQKLKELAQSENVAIIICHHLRKSMRNSDTVQAGEEPKDIEYTIPTLENIKGSSKIADFATDVWGLVRFYGENKGNKTVLRILKNRTGKIGTLELDFDFETLSFEEKERTGLMGIFEGFADKTS